MAIAKDASRTRTAHTLPQRPADRHDDHQRPRADRYLIRTSVIPQAMLRNMVRPNAAAPRTRTHSQRTHLRCGGRLTTAHAAHNGRSLRRAFAVPAPWDISS